MRVGVVREIKDSESRVALTPEGAAQLVAGGHEVLVQAGAGSGSGFTDEQYLDAGARLCTAAQAWASDLVLKIKEPLPQEYCHLQSNLLFTYLHLAGVDPALTAALLAAGTTAIAYETVEDDVGLLPLLAPMSAIAGNMAITMGNHYLARHNGGRGVQLAQVLGQRNGRVMVIGLGSVGQHAARMASAMGAEVLVVGRAGRDAEWATSHPMGGMRFVESNPDNIARHITAMDLVVGAVLRVGERAPHLVSEAMVRSMQAGSVIVDVSVDQGGCVETSRPTSHSDPVFTMHEVIHYCVTNMPGAYPRTATQALTERTLPYVLRLAAGGHAALDADPGFRKGVNTRAGRITCPAVARAAGVR
ncbi:MAG: alanine dehydrogenase [Halioglobus sp.]|nr:alanine dehydrogenase [Halioglobus sp.]|tara:strand:+ start:1106 stop:2185 length:1080 start_codon:yes stop_codon:yes gene_type:complete